jgi:hypothetical protein
MSSSDSRPTTIINDNSQHFSSPTTFALSGFRRFETGQASYPHPVKNDDPNIESASNSLLAARSSKERGEAARWRRRCTHKVNDMTE